MMTMKRGPHPKASAAAFTLALQLLGGAVIPLSEGSHAHRGSLVEEWHSEVHSCVGTSAADCPLLRVLQSAGRCCDALAARPVSPPVVRHPLAPETGLRDAATLRAPLARAPPAA